MKTIELTMIDHLSSGVNSLYGLLTEAGADENVVDIVSVVLRHQISYGIKHLARAVSYVLQR